MDSAESYLSRAVQQLEQGCFAQAAAIADEALEKFPDESELWQVEGMAHHRLRNYPAALTAMETASRLGPLAPGSQRVLADCYAQVGKTDLAKWLYRDLVQQPDCPGTLLPEVAADLGRLGDDDAALAVCHAMLERDPDCPRAHFGVGYYMNRLNHPPETILPFLETAYRIAPNVAMYRVGLALLRDRLGDINAAYELLKTVPTSEVYWPHSLSRMLQIYQAVGDVCRCLDCKARIMQLAAYSSTCNACTPPKPGRSESK
jgi:tetratricopeptide (TPR) repeat protein